MVQEKEKRVVELHKHQVAAVEFMVENKKTILADKCGVGKTYPAIVFAGKFKGKKLIVCPAYLVANWEEEIGKIFPRAVVKKLEGSPAQKIVVIGEQYDFLLTSYGLLRQMRKITKNNKTFTVPKYKTLFDIQWQCVVFDEGHRLRKQGSNTAKNARRLSTPHLAILTATPIVKNFGDLFSPLKLCDQNKYSSYWRFVEDHCKLTKTPWATEVGRLKNEQQSFSSIADRVLMRSPDDCNIEWPDFSIKEVRLEGSKRLYRAYARAKKEYIAEIGVSLVDCRASADLISNCRKMLINPPGAQNPKLDAIKGIVADNEGKTLVYCWYKDNAKFLANELGAHLITGENKDDRQEIVKDWKSSKTSHTLVATLKAVNEGNNWQHCATIIFCDAHWTMADNEQGIGRCVRYGQKETVRVFVLMIKRSFDTTVWRLAKGRGNVNDQLLLLQDLKNK